MTGASRSSFDQPRRRRLVWVVGLAALASVLLLGWFLYEDRRQAIDALMDRNQLTLSVSWEATQALQRNSVSTYFEEYGLDPQTLSILRTAQDPQQIDLARLQLFRHLTPAYERMVERGIRQFHFHRPNGDSFLRFHYPARFGDNLFGVRDSIRQANQTLVPVFGFEVGRVASGYRSVFPIIDDQGMHLGSVELSLPFKEMLEELQALMPGHDFELILEADKQRDIAFDEQQNLFEAWPASERFLVEDPHRLRPDSPPPASPVVEDIVNRLAEFPDIDEMLMDVTRSGLRVEADGRDFVVLRVPVEDPLGERVAFLMSYVEEPQLAIIDQSFWVRLVVGFAGLAALFAMVFVWLKALDSRLSERSRLKIVSDTMGQGLYLADEDGRIVSMNPRACELLGYEEEFAVGRLAHDLFHQHEQNNLLRKEDCPVMQGLRDTGEFRGETVFQRADGKTIEVSVVSRAIVSNTGSKSGHAGAVTVFEDIGQRKQAERALKESRQRLANIVWGTGVGTWEWNVQTGEARFNERWAELLGYQLADLEPISIATWERLGHPEDLARSKEALQRHFEGQTEHYEAEVRVRHRNGHWIWVLDRGRVISRTPTGKPEWVVGTHLDITDRKQAEEIAREAQALLQAAMESSPSGIVIADADDGSTRFVNPAATELLAGGLDSVNASSKDASGALKWRVLNADGTPLSTEELPLMRAMRSGEVISGLELIHEYNDGERRWLSVSAAPIFNDKGNIGAGIVVFSDISEQKSAQAELRKRAHYDALTGLPNRVLLADRLEQAMSRARRDGRLLAVAFIDLDNFKPINDEFGHDMGDRLLVEISQRMRQTLREVDTLARFGGDEFIAVLSDLQEADDTEVLLERLLRALSRPIEMNGQSLRVTGSIGLALFPQAEALDADQLIRQADQAMYSAKLQGRNRWHFFDGDLHHRESGNGDADQAPPLQ